MLRVFSAGSPIPEIGAYLYDGKSVVAETAEDIETLLALALECRSQGLSAVYEWLGRLDHWVEWFEYQRDSYRRYTDSSLEVSYQQHPANLSEVERLASAILVAREMWNDLGEESAAISFVLSLTDKSVGIKYEGETPALFFHQGSIHVSLTPFVPHLVPGGRFLLNIGLYGVGLALRLAVLPSVQADNLTEELRDAAGRNARFPKLPRLHDLERRNLEGKQGILLLIHGLFSTDINTFDGFIHAWGDPPPRIGRGGVFETAFRATVNADYLVAGWPHNSLTSIETNARDLYDLILNKFGPSCPPIVLVCHSRGGLVARKTAVLLQENAAWADKIKLCVTFGTPHVGAEMAEHPLTLVAAYLAFLSGTRSMLSLVRVLALYRYTKKFDGIDDMIPESVRGESFLQRLRDAERRLSPDGLRKLQIVPVGAEYRGPKRVLSTVATGLLGTAAHDLIVPRRSSVPQTYSDGHITHCTHGSYFDESEVVQEHFRQIVDRIRNVLQFNENFERRVAAELSSSARLPPTNAPRHSDLPLGLDADERNL